jgi:hypothetical protein
MELAVAFLLLLLRLSAPAEAGFELSPAGGTLELEKLVGLALAEDNGAVAAEFHPRAAVV